MEVAASTGWRDARLADIAAAAGVSLADLHAHFASKAAILAAFSRRIDAEVLARDDPDIADQPARDRLFDVLMRRFDALAPHKAALRVIVRETATDPFAAAGAAVTLHRSMAWMLEAARLRGSGPGGLIRCKGLAAIYLATLRVWFDDDSEDMARTMAALDRRLNQVERVLRLCRRPRWRWSTAPPPEAPSSAMAD